MSVPAGKWEPTQTKRSVSVGSDHSSSRVAVRPVHRVAERAGVRCRSRWWWSLCESVAGVPASSAPGFAGSIAFASSAVSRFSDEAREFRFLTTTATSTPPPTTIAMTSGSDRKLERLPGEVRGGADASGTGTDRFATCRAGSATAVPQYVHVAKPASSSGAGTGAPQLLQRMAMGTHRTLPKRRRPFLPSPRALVVSGGLGLRSRAPQQNRGLVFEHPERKRLGQIELDLRPIVIDVADRPILPDGELVVSTAR